MAFRGGRGHDHAGLGEESVDIPWPIDDKAEATGYAALAGGKNAAASGTSSIAFGENAAASGEEAVAMGQNTVASSDNAVALGYAAQATQPDAAALGFLSTASHARSVAFAHDGTTAEDQVQFGSHHAEFEEISDPASPAANAARVYARDNGAGQTQVVVLFATGAAQVIATQP